MAFDFDITGNTKLDTNGFTNGISSMTVAAGTLIADFVKSATSKMAELVTSSVDIGASFETALAKVSTIADTGKVSVGELSKQILDTSSSMGVAAADIAEAASGNQAWGLWRQKTRRAGWCAADGCTLAGMVCRAPEGAGPTLL